jgi:hypothetical protein
MIGTWQHRIAEPILTCQQVVFSLSEECHRSPRETYAILANTRDKIMTIR